MEEEREEIASEEAAVIAPSPSPSPSPPSAQQTTTPVVVKVVEAATVDVDEKLEDAKNPIPESTTTTTAKPTSSFKNANAKEKKLVKELASHNSAREPEIKTGKRERKKTEFLSATLLQSPEKKKHEQDKKVQKEGEGSKLRDIENVKFAMDKMKR
jgi:alpha-ketoglutarate-dependent taurine dioxygenase